MLENKIPLDNNQFTGVIINNIPNRIVEPKYLTESSFAYDFFYFKLNSNTDLFEVHGLYHEGVREILEHNGYFKRYLNPEKAISIKQVGRIIEEISPENIKESFQNYVFSFSKNIDFNFNNVDYSIPIETIRTIFLRQSNIFFNDKWLEHLTPHTIPILRDTEYKSFLVFKNCFVQTSKKDGIEIEKLDKLQEYCVWKSQIIDRNFKYIDSFENCEFAKFCRNVSNDDQNRFDSLCSAMGYLCHTYFNPTEGQAVLLYDEAKTDKLKPMGGSGKGLVANAIKQVKAQVKIDGKHWDSANRFKLEMVKPSSQVVWIDDPKPDFDFTVLFSNLTDGWTIERKHLTQFFIKPEDSPKVLICSNTILDRDGTSNKRRQFILELNDYYSKQIIIGNEKPIEKEHGVLFSEKWSNKDWNLFYSFMIVNIMLYFKEGLIPCQLKNVDANFLVQKTNADFVEWIENYPVLTQTSYNTKELFIDFTTKHYGDDSKFKQRGFTNWLKMYAQSIQAEFKINSSNGISTFILKSKN